MDENAGEHEMESVEKIFEAQEVPTWKGQLTLRAFVVSLLLSVAFTFVVMKLMLTNGIIPELNVAAGLLGYCFVRGWTTIFARSGVMPFTRQENTVIQTFVVASSGIAFSGGLGSYILGMSNRVASQSNAHPDVKDFKDPSLPWMIGFLFLVSFVGLLSVIPFRKIMIVDFKLTYPSATATAYLINTFHTPQGGKTAKKQVKQLGKYFSISFLWGFFKWFFQAADGCGFENFPTFGLKALTNSFYFDFSATYVGAGMLCPPIINISVLLGGILSWGLMWPLIQKKAGHWYPADESNMHGLQGYKVFISIAMILGDGLYNFIKVMRRTLAGLYHQFRKKDNNILSAGPDSSSPENSGRKFDEQKRTRLFLKDRIPTWFALAGYIAIAAISTGTLPRIFPQLKWYYVLVLYTVAPPLAFCNAYGCGLTGWSLAGNYGQLAIFVIGAWAGQAHGGILAGLAAGVTVMNIVSAASYLTEDFKTGYLTLASPRSMFIVQVIGTAMGCLISPCVFWVFYKAYDNLGLPGSEYPAPYAGLYRSIAQLGVEGFSSLPSHCLTLCLAFFVAAFVINGVRDLVGKRWARFIPVPMAMAMPFYIGSYFGIDMCVGSLILFVLEKLNKTKVDTYAPVVASGLICGEALWSLPSSVLAMARIRPPICMKFLSNSTNKRVDDFLQSLS